MYDFTNNFLLHIETVYELQNDYKDLNVEHKVFYYNSINKNKVNKTELVF